VIEGSEASFYQFHDVFDPGFRMAVRATLEHERGKSAGAPWCLGYFVDNEMNWGEDTDLAGAVLRSSPGQYAKKVLVEELQARYGDVAALNRAWGTRHATWDDLRKSSQPPANAQGARADLKRFNRRIAETYFRICRDEVKRIAPGQLYLGCRFTWEGEFGFEQAAKYCDVVSFNLYRLELESLRLPRELGVPVIIGEFHFGATDRNNVNSALVEVADQRERAAALARYVRSALANPLVVGVHWFQYMDEAVTGRGDGENYQAGFVGVTDAPYAETVAASRDVGAQLYRLRAGGKR
ncbi:MAG: beta-galactosidase, partial [bacterium]